MGGRALGRRATDVVTERGRIRGHRAGILDSPAVVPERGEVAAVAMVNVEGYLEIMRGALRQVDDPSPLVVLSRKGHSVVAELAERAAPAGDGREAVFSRRRLQRPVGEHDRG